MTRNELYAALEAMKDGQKITLEGGILLMVDSLHRHVKWTGNLGSKDAAQLKSIDFIQAKDGKWVAFASWNPTTESYQYLRTFQTTRMDQGDYKLISSAIAKIKPVLCDQVKAGIL